MANSNVEESWPVPDGWQTDSLIPANDAIVWARKLPGADRSSPASQHQGPNPVLVRNRLIGEILNPGAIFAADPVDGKILWTHPTNHLASQGLVFDDEHVYAGGPNHLRAIRISDGVLVWKFDPNVGKGDQFYTVPLLLGDSLYLSDRGGRLSRISKREGECLWSSLVDPGSHDANASPALIDGKVVTGTNSGIVVACDPKSGRIVWQRRFDGPITWKIQAYRGLVLGSC